MHHHKYGYTDLENMMAWERQVYVVLTQQYLKDENERLKLEKATRR